MAPSPPEILTTVPPYLIDAATARARQSVVRSLGSTGPDIVATLSCGPTGFIGAPPTAASVNWTALGTAFASGGVIDTPPAVPHGRRTVAYRLLVVLFTAALIGGVARAQSGPELTGVSAAAPAPRTTLRLTEAYELLAANYPLLDNAALARQLYERQLELLDIARRPTLTARADARLQSEATQLVSEGEQALPLEVDLPLYSAQAYGEARYTILDGGLNRARRALAAAQLRVDEHQSAVDAYPLRGRVNQAFLAITTLRENDTQLELALADVRERAESIAAAVEFGTALRSELTKLRVRELELIREREHLDGRVAGLIATLAELTAVPLADTLELIYPDLPATAEVPALDRPETELFSAQEALLLARGAVTDAARKPTLAAFAQAGAGYPNPLNLFDTGLAPYALGGLNFSVPITDWGKAAVERERQRLEAARVANRRATLAFDLETQVGAYREDVLRLRGQIARDREIIALQSEVTEAVAAQLDEGVATAVDYVTQLNAETAARAQLSLHRAELLDTQLTFLNDRGAL